MEWHFLLQESRPRLDTAAAKPITGKPKILVVGTGWSSISFLKSLKRRAK